MRGILSINRLLVSTLIIALLVSTACTSTPPTSPTTSTNTPTPPTAARAIPPEVTQYAKDWPLPNRDYANTRATMDTAINSGNVKSLGVAWAIPLPGRGIFGAASTTPIIIGNTAYFQDLGNNIFAIDLATGALKWKKLFNESNIGPNGIAIG